MKRNINSNNLPTMLESDAVTDLDKHRRAVDVGFSPPQVYVCHDCGYKGNLPRIIVNDINNAQTAPRATLTLDALCMNCESPLDTIKVSVIFMGIGFWQVLKSHVG